MKDTIITTINHVEIVVTSDMFVPIKPICEVLGIAFPRQSEKIKSDAILSSTVTQRVTVGADGKQREMLCLPLKYVFGWVFSINPDNVKEQSRENIIRYKQECYDVLYEHFHKRYINYDAREQSFERTIALQKELADLRLKVEKSGADFDRYLEIEQQLRHEKAVRKALTAESLTALRTLFD
ncbi:phage antirepressor N-terminal domain-containing protein [uncultured Rikenella sp.]|uniref:phage antirepressor N-terminal domain-containing protein n=1 Tax=uncultured Rikenella sp. TaxID=368003 RepID=UPI0025EEFE68|nr:phage antirepressor N-terminal domain-containing protein [uncultured Rikenella sp.]